MRTYVVAALAAVLLVPPFLAAAQAPPAAARAFAQRDAKERSPDLLRRVNDPARRAALARLEAAAAAAGLAGTGDPDSFGRAKRYLGVAQTIPIVLQADCTGSSPDVERCVVPTPPPDVTFVEFLDLARIDLPAKATNSLVCYALTPLVAWAFFDSWGIQPFAQFSAYAEITIENPVLADPALIDPDTGVPFGGKLTLALGTFNEARTLGQWEYAYKRYTMSRDCIGGIINKATLIGYYGLSESQATEFFRQPMTYRFGAVVSASWVDMANYFYGIRLYGD